MSILWLTDPHFNFLKREDTTFRFVQYLLEENPDADGLVITGDISSGEVLEKHLTQIVQGFPHPIYIVTGNHDYYKSSFQKIDDMLTRLTQKHKTLHWLNQGNHIYQGISLVGVGGWYDCRQGNTRTRVELSDFEMIEDLWCGLKHRDLMIELVRKRAIKEAERLDTLLYEEICNVGAGVVLIATHISPYPESSWHEGEQSNREWLPWFCSHVTGEVIDKYAERYPEKKFVVLCGHGHSPGIYRRLDNLVIYTGAARYGSPELAGKLDVSVGKFEVLNHIGRKVEESFP